MFTEQIDTVEYANAFISAFLLYLYAVGLFCCFCTIAEHRNQVLTSPFVRFTHVWTNQNCVSAHFFSIAKRSWIHSEQCRKPPPPPPLPSSFTLCIYFAVACKLIGDDVQIAVRPTSEKQFYTRIALCTGARYTRCTRKRAENCVNTRKKTRWIWQTWCALNTRQMPYV